MQGGFYHIDCFGNAVGFESQAENSFGARAIVQSPYAVQPNPGTAVVQENDVDMCEDEGELINDSCSGTDSDSDMFSDLGCVPTGFVASSSENPVVPFFTSPCFIAAGLNAVADPAKAGQKRKRSAGDQSKAPAAKRVRKSKYNGINLEAVAYWQTHPEEQGQLQLCDKDGKILYAEAVTTRQGQRSLNEGKLRINHNGKKHCFKRHPNDKADLENYGFKDSYAGVFKTYEANQVVKKSKYDGVNSMAVAYWQIHPEEQGQLQLCNKDGKILHTESVKTQYGVRSLYEGVLYIKGLIISITCLSATLMIRLT